MATPMDVSSDNNPVDDLSKQLIDFIDNKNNLHCNFTFDIKNTLNNKEILLLLGEKPFKIPSNLLFVQRTQSYVLRNQGILLIDDNHLYSTEKRGNIYVDIIFE